jgi:DNA primase
MNNNVEEIKARLNIVDVVGEYVRLTKAGSHWKGLCPFHHEKSPSFMVNEEKQIFHCFGCAKGGDVFSFVQEIESMEFRDALKILAEKAGVELDEFKGQQYDNKKRILAALELATKFYETQLWKGVGRDNILGYLRERGLTDESIVEFRLGYAPSGWDNIMKFLIERGFNLEEIRGTGLLVQKDNGAGQYDRFRDRIMFPIQDAMSNVVGYSARMSPGGDESQAKYINTPETSIYHKSNILYGISHAKNEIKKKNYTLLVEGNMDVIASHQAGLKNTVAVSGTALTEQQITTLKRYSENMAMLFDMDSAGQQAAKKSADLCFEKGMNVKIVSLENGKDAADAVRQNPENLLNAVKNSLPALEYFLNKLLIENDRSTAEGKNKIAKEIISHLVHFDNKIEKTHWVKKIAHALDVEEKLIIDVLNTETMQNSRLQTPSVNVSMEKETSFQSRSDILRNSLVGLIVSYPLIWKNTFENEFEKEWVKNDALIKFILEKGESVGYSFDTLIENINEEVTRERLRKIFFDSKYRFDSDEVVEYSQEDVAAILPEHVASFVKELQKEKMHATMRQIADAEKSGDKEKIKILLEEHRKLSQEL